MRRSGNPGAYQQPSNWGRNDSGNFEVWVFEGTPQEIRNVAAYFAQTVGLNYNVQEGFGKWRLEVFFPWNQDGLVSPRTDQVVRWELFAQHAEKDLLNSIDNAGLVQTLSPGQIAQLRYYQSSPPPPGTVLTAANFTNSKPPPDDSSTAGTALRFWNLFASGETSYLVEAPVLRRSIVTSLQWAVAYTAQYAGKILSTDTLLKFENVPSLLLSPVIATFSGLSAPQNSNLSYGWYKSFPTVQQTALMKWQIVQEWQFGWWSFPYGTPI